MPADYGEEGRQLLDALERAGIDTEDFGRFVGRPFPEAGIEPAFFDYAGAVPILVAWLPRVRDPVLKEVIARSLTGESAPGASMALVEEFRRASPDEWGLKWALGNALSTIADAEVADDLIELLRNRAHGMTRQMLCDALRRTKDPRAPDVLIELIPDPDVGGHAIGALRAYGPKSSIPYLRRARPALERVGRDPSATGYSRHGAKKALERLGAS